MADKNLYANDLIHRYALHTFTELTVSSMTLVTFKNAGGTIITLSKNLDVIDAYRDIRSNLLDGETPAFQSTTTQRNALTNLDQATLIYNITTSKFEIYIGTAWLSVAGSGVMAPSAYGSMYENNETGSPINATSKGWVTATAGVFDTNSIVTFLNNSSADRLVIGTGGAGNYQVEAKCDQTNAGGNTTLMVVLVNGINSIVKDEHASDSGDHRQLTANGIVTLADNDYLSIWVASQVPPDLITAYHSSLTINRLS